MLWLRGILGIVLIAVAALLLFRMNEMALGAISFIFGFLALPKMEPEIGDRFTDANRALRRKRWRERGR